MNPRDAQDNRREFLKSQLKRISAHWPLQASAEALDEYARVLWGFTDDEITAGFDAVIDSHTEMAAPKPSHIRTAVGNVAKARRGIRPPDAELIEQGIPLFRPAADVEAIERWATIPGNASLVQEELDLLTHTWDEAMRQYRHVLLPTARRIAYERRHGAPQLRVMP
jgi:hypothetical protein